VKMQLRELPPKAIREIGHSGDNWIGVCVVTPGVNYGVLKLFENAVRQGLTQAGIAASEICAFGRGFFLTCVVKTLDACADKHQAAEELCALANALRIGPVISAAARECGGGWTNLLADGVPFETFVSDDALQACENELKRQGSLLAKNFDGNGNQAVGG